MPDVAVVTNKGLDIITSRLKGLGNEPKYIGWGTGTTPASKTDTVLQNPASESRVNGTSSQETINVENDTYQVVGILTCAGAPKSITEIGLFDAAANGNMFMRCTFDPIPLAVGDSIQFIINNVASQEE